MYPPGAEIAVITSLKCFSFQKIDLWLLLTTEVIQKTESPKFIF